MVHKQSGQLDLAGSLIVNNPKLNRRLDKIQKFIDWESIASILSPIYSATIGRPSYALLVLFKCLFVKKGTLVDATVIESVVTNPHQKEDGKG